MSNVNLKRKGGNNQNKEENNLGSEAHKKIKLNNPDQINISQQIKDSLIENNLKNLIKVTQGKSFYKEYKKLKFKNTIYEIGEDICIFNADDQEQDFIGKLIKIIRIDHEQVLTLIQVQWFYRKSDIAKQKGVNIEPISENEVFLTEHTDYNFVDTINGKCSILTYEEYDLFQSIPTNTFYSRAKFDTVKKKFNPAMDKWNKGCICGKPLNPDLEYVMCEKCELWLHLQCVGLSQVEVDNIEKYLCPKCKQNKQ